MPDRVLASTKYLRLIDRDGWFFVERPDLVGVAIIVALTDNDEMVFVEQPRRAVGVRTIELPAGLVGDDPRLRGESIAEAARRELLEETGFRAAHIQPLPVLGSSPGMTSELSSFFLATGLERVAPGGGVDGEDIAVHVIPFSSVDAWLAERAAAGHVIAVKVYAGLYFAARHRAGR